MRKGNIQSGFQAGNTYTCKVSGPEATAETWLRQPDRDKHVVYITNREWWSHNDKEVAMGNGAEDSMG